MDRPNILLIVLDTARADAFEPYGAPAGSSPTVHDLARSGQIVPQAYASSCWTLPSHATMFTGELGRALGLGQEPPDGYRGIRRTLRSLDDRLLPSVLRRAGYTTAGASCNMWISPATGFDTGFDDFSYVASPRGEPFNRAGLRGDLGWLWKGTLARMDDGAREVERRMRAWFAEWDARRPFFWFVNLVECHTPYLPPRPYNDLTIAQRLLATLDVKRYQTLAAIWRNAVGEFDVADQPLRRMRHLYTRAVRMLDDWVARVLELLEARGILEDTVVIITSDHGENLGEGGLFGHCFSLDERLIHVPLVVAGPAGTSFDRVTSLAALPAFLSRVAQLDDPPWEPPPADGVAIAQIDPMAGRDDPRVERVRREWHLDERSVRLFTDPMTCATDGRWKIVRHGDEERVYDLAADPLELRPVAPGPEVAPLRDALHRDAVWATGDALPAEDEGDPPPETEVQELEEQMRLLGYM